MTDKQALLTQMLSMLETTGLAGITPVEINDGGNLIIHLSPYPVVARIAVMLSEEDPITARQIQERELRVAAHLHSSDVPVLLPSDIVDPGPHAIGGVCMTLWRYEPRADLPRPTPAEAVRLIDSLSAGMKDYPGELPVLGAWETTCQSAFRLQDHPDQRVQRLLELFQKVDIKIRKGAGSFIPSHGDTNIGNLFPSASGWIWMDFENVSLMPKYWDLASFICILALFKGIQEPTFTYVLEQIDNADDTASFGLTLIARTLASTLGNLDYALIGHGDLDFALSELAIAEDFIRQVDRMTGNGTISGGR